MWQDTLSKRYAKAYFNTCKEPVSGLLFLQELTSVLDQNPQFKDFLLSPAINAKDKSEIIKKITKENNNNNFLDILVAKGRLILLERIKKYYQEMLEEIQGIKNGKIYSPYTLDKDVVKSIEKSISDKLKTKVTLNNEIDKNIAIGFKAIIGNYQLDGTLESKLQKLRSHK